MPLTFPGMVIVRRIALLVLTLIAGRLYAQTAPSTPPTISFAATAVSTDWFTGANWNLNRVPSISDDVGIGLGKTATINTSALARTVTLGDGTGANYRVGNLIVAAPPVPSGSPASLVISHPATPRTPALEILSGSQLTVQNGGSVFLREGFASVNGGTLELQNQSSFSGPITVQGQTGVLRVDVLETSTGTAATFQNGGTLDNSGTLGAQINSTANLTFNSGGVTVINRQPGQIAGTSGSNGLSLNATSTIQNAGQISGVSTNGFSGDGILAKGEGTISNSGVIKGGDGIVLNAGGTLTNSGTVQSTLGGNDSGVYAPFPLVNPGGAIASAAAVTPAAPGTTQVVNTGVITSAAGNGVELDNGGSITNSAPGTITGANNGVQFGDGVNLPANPSTLTNSGTITGFNGVRFNAPGTVVNNAGGQITGSVDGGDGIVAPLTSVAPQPVTVNNSGTISGPTGIDLEGGGAITNSGGGSITGSSGTAIITNGALVNLSNAGAITGNVALGNFANSVTLLPNGKITGTLNLGTSAAATLILGGDASQQFLSQAVTGLITNNGALVKQGTGDWIIDRPSGSNAAGVTIDSGTLTITPSGSLGTGTINVNGNTSLLQIDPGATLSNSIVLNQGSMQNAGTVNGTTNGVTVNAGNVTNLSTGIIRGNVGFNGVNFFTPGTLTNAGAIIGGANGINLAAGGSITNNSGATITGNTNAGILASGGSTTITNSGTINGVTGVQFDAPGTVVNNAGGQITGTLDGIVAPLTNLAPPPVTISNSGTISGPTGIDLEGGGAITNNAGGSITGSSGTAIITNGALVNLSNAGAITGNVALGNFANSVTLLPNGKITGTLNLGTSAAATLILGGDASQQFLSQAVTGLITNNGALVKQGTGDWIIDRPSGSNAAGVTIGSGTLTITPSGSLGTGTINVNGNTSLLQIDPGATLSNSIVLNQGGSMQNAGTVNGTADGITANTGSGNLANLSTGVIRGNAGFDGIRFSVPGTLTNAGAIIGGANGINLAAGGSITNNSGATITGNTNAGILASGRPTAITNSGTITGAAFGVNLTSGGSVTNNGVIAANAPNGFAILGLGAPVQFTNVGTVNGNVSLGNFSNSATLISGERIIGNLNLGAGVGSSLILDGSGVQNLSDAVTGTVTNFGSLTKQGQGNWIIDEALNAPVSTKILAGILTVNSSLQSQSVLIQPGATLRGSGTINGELINAGLLQPGNPRGTLTVNGNFIQNSSGVLSAEIVSSTVYDRLVVNGHATLGGTLRLTLASGATLPQKFNLQIVTATQGISGTFSNVIIPNGSNVSRNGSQIRVIYNGNEVDLTQVPAQVALIPVADGTPQSTTAVLANASFSSAFLETTHWAVDATGKQNAVSISFDGGTFRVNGTNGRAYTIPIAGHRQITDRISLDYIIPLQYIEVQGYNQFQGGLTLNLPVRAVLAREDQPWSWTTTPSAAFADAGNKELIFGAALSNVITYHWKHKVNIAYGNYFSAFAGNTIWQDAPQFTSGVSQQMMKHGLRVSVTPTPDWLYEAYVVYTQFFHSALVSNFYTIGVSIGRHLSAEIYGQHVDLGFFSIGAYTDIGNRYNSGFFQLGSAWTF